MARFRQEVYASTETDVYSCVQEAVSSPELQRNLRGQVCAGLNCLPQVTQNRLACSFVEHGLRQLLESDPKKFELALQSIEVVWNFLDGAATIHDVVSATKTLVQADGIKEATPDGRWSYSIGVAGSTLRSLEECCCKRELKAAKLVLPGISLRTNAATIAQDMCRGIAYHVGGSDWDSDDKDLRQAARQRGKKASDNEAIWQLDLILEYSARLSASPQEDSDAPSPT